MKYPIKYKLLLLISTILISACGSNSDSANSVTPTEKVTLSSVDSLLGFWTTNCIPLTSSKYVRNFLYISQDEESFFIHTKATYSDEFCSDTLTHEQLGGMFNLKQEINGQGQKLDLSIFLHNATAYNQTPQILNEEQACGITSWTDGIEVSILENSSCSSNNSLGITKTFNQQEQVFNIITLKKDGKIYLGDLNQNQTGETETSRPKTLSAMGYQKQEGPL